MMQWNGAFGLKGRGPIALADITDGPSNTAAAVSEKIMSPFPLNWNPRTDLWCTGLFSGYPAPAPDGDAVFGLCGRLTGTPIAYHTDTGFTWLGMGTEFTDYNHIAPPNSPIPDCAMNSHSATATPNPYSNTMGPTKATSYHPGGVNLLFVDGHVEFKSNAIDPKVRRAPATRAGREQL